MRRAESNSLIHMTPLTTARHPSISEELDNMPQATGMVTSGLNPETIDKYRQVSMYNELCGNATTLTHSDMCA